MKTSSRKICHHDRQYDTNGKALFMSLVTNCTRCYLELHNKMCVEKSIRIHQMKIFGKTEWKRRGKRLVRVRDCFDPNFKCEKFGIECDYKNPKHELELTYETPVIFDISKKIVEHHSFLCFPKYKGNAEFKYRKEIARKKLKTEQIVKKTNRYLDFEGICYQCGLTFDVRRDLRKHEEEHVLAEMGYETSLWKYETSLWKKE